MIVPHSRINMNHFMNERGRPRTGGATHFFAEGDLVLVVTIIGQIRVPKKFVFQPGVVFI